MPEIKSAPNTKRPCKLPDPDSGATPIRSGSGETSFAVRPYRPDDEVSLISIWNSAVWADPIDAATWRGRYLADPNFRRENCLIADSGDQAVGFLLGFIGSNNADAADGPGWIVSMGVLPGKWRRGFGRALFGAFERAARAGMLVDCGRTLCAVLHRAGGRYRQLPGIAPFL